MAFLHNFETDTYIVAYIVVSLLFRFFFEVFLSLLLYRCCIDA